MVRADLLCLRHHPSARRRGPEHHFQDKAGWPRADPGPNKVATLLFDWQDARRDRKVPVKIYYPADMSGPAPSSSIRMAPADRARATPISASSGPAMATFPCIRSIMAPDNQMFKGNPNTMDALKKAVAPDPRNAMSATRDVSFVLDELARLNKEHAALKGKLNLDAVGLSGHSFGGHTTMVSAGQTMGGSRSRTNASRRSCRCRAAPPKVGVDKAYVDVKLPMMLMSGRSTTARSATPRPRTGACQFDKVQGVDKWFINFEDGDHMIFSGRLAKDPQRKTDADFQRVIKQASLAFWDAYLKSDADAKAWLSGKGFRNMSASWRTVEMEIGSVKKKARRGEPAWDSTYLDRGLIGCSFELVWQALQVSLSLSAAVLMLAAFLLATALDDKQTAASRV